MSGFESGSLQCGPTVPSERIKMLDMVESTNYDLNIYDFTFWENMVPEKWNQVFNHSLQGWTYKPYSLYRKNHRSLVGTFINVEGLEKTIQLPYREKFSYKWHDFIELIQNSLD